MLKIISLFSIVIFGQVGFSNLTYAGEAVCDKFAEQVGLSVANQDIKGVEDAACDGESNCLGQKAKLQTITLDHRSSSLGWIVEDYTVLVKGFHKRTVEYNVVVESSDISFCEVRSINRKRK